MREVVYSNAKMIGKGGEKMNFKEQRLSAKLTQADAAKRLGLGRTAVSMWETGEALPRADLLPKIAAVRGRFVQALQAA